MRNQIISLAFTELKRLVANDVEYPDALSRVTRILELSSKEVEAVQDLYDAIELF